MALNRFTNVFAVHITAFEPTCQLSFQKHLPQLVFFLRTECYLQYFKNRGLWSPISLILQYEIIEKLAT